MWMCDTGAIPGKTGYVKWHISRLISSRKSTTADTLLKSCGFFQWAEFDDDGNPPWVDKAAAENFKPWQAMGD